MSEFILGKQYDDPVWVLGRDQRDATRWAIYLGVNLNRTISVDSLKHGTELRGQGSMVVLITPYASLFGDNFGGSKALEQLYRRGFAKIEYLPDNESAPRPARGDRG